MLHLSKKFKFIHDSINTAFIVDPSFVHNSDCILRFGVSLLTVPASTKTAFTNNVFHYELTLIYLYSFKLQSLHPELEAQGMSLDMQTPIVLQYFRKLNNQMIVKLYS